MRDLTDRNNLLFGSKKEEVRDNSRAIQGERNNLKDLIHNLEEDLKNKPISPEDREKLSKKLELLRANYNKLIN